MTKEERIEKAVSLFKEGYNCSQSVVAAYADLYGFTREQALHMAGLSARDIGYISAHGTATDRGDIAESQATAAVFGARTPTSSLKSYFGHTLGACGALEAWMSLKMIPCARFYRCLKRLMILETFLNPIKL